MRYKKIFSKYKNKRSLLRIIGLAVILSLAVYWCMRDKQFVYAGTLDSTKVDLAAELPSVIAMVNVEEGERVQAGQKLVKLTCEDYIANAEFAENDYNRNIRLYKRGVIPGETFDISTNKKQNADIRLNWCSISSPINGTVLSRYHEPGEYATPGLKILTLANIKDVWAYVYVPQPKIAQLKIGMEVQGRLPELKGRVFTGKIVKINSEAEFTPKNVQTESERTRLVFGIKVSFLGVNDEEILKPGMTIDIILPKA